MAAPDQPPPPPTSFTDLPGELLLSILPCKADRGRASLVCKAWRAALSRRNLRAPRPLPWLLLPTPFAPDGSTRVACVLSGCRIHHHLDIGPPGARCFGSHDGAWLFLHYGPARSYKLLSVRAPRAFDLPGELLRWNGPDVHDMLILAATLSSSPDDPGCVAAAIVAAWRRRDPPPDGAVPHWPPVQICRRVAFWRTGCPRAIEIPPDANQAVYQVEDVVYHDGAFHFLLADGSILLSKPTKDQTAENIVTNWELLRFRPHRRFYYQYVRARYLVVSRGELLMVARFTTHPGQPWTSKFKVFRMTEREDPNAEYPWSWRKMDTLGGRMLFVGYGCSRSYEMEDQYPTDLKDGIYFLDDGKFYDEVLIFGNDGIVRQYPCSDNGKWSEEGHVQRCFPRPDPSTYSAPAWLLP